MLRRWSIVGGLAAALAACNATLTAPSPVSGGGKPPGTPAAVTKQPLDIARAEIPKLQGEALDGSGAAAYRLAQYYGSAAFDQEEELYWMALAAENGDVRAAYGFGVLLSKRASERDRARARYWLIQARDAGQEPVSGLAADVLTKMGDGKPQ